MRIGPDHSAFVAEIGRLMAEKGIADMWELYERFMEGEPERIGGAHWTFARFRRYAATDVDYIDFRFMVPLTEALEATEKELRRLATARI